MNKYEYKEHHQFLAEFNEQKTDKDNANQCQILDGLQKALNHFVQGDILKEYDITEKNRVMFDPKGEKITMLNTPEPQKGTGARVLAQLLYSDLLEDGVASIPKCATVNGECLLFSMSGDELVLNTIN